MRQVTVGDLGVELQLEEPLAENAREREIAISKRGRGVVEARR